MELSVHPSGTAACLRLSGRLDSTAVDRIEPGVRSAVAAAGGPVLIDLDAVSFVSSMGIRLLITIAKAQHAAGQRLVVFGARPLVRELFDTVALDQIVPLAADESAALQLATQS